MKKIILVAVLTGLFLTLLASTQLFSTWNYKLTDPLYGGRDALDNIVIIGIDDKSLQEVGRWPWKRTVYIDLLDEINQANVIGFDIGFFEPTEDDKLLEEAMQQAGNVIVAQEYDFTRQTTLTPTIDVPKGMVNIFTDVDGVNRRVPLTLYGEPSFATMISMQYLGHAPQANHELLVNFAGRPGTFKTISATDVINGRVTPEMFRDAIVLIGATAPDLHDDYLVPTSEGTYMPGVEIHANALQTIITKQYLKHQSFASLAFIILIFSWLVGFLYTRLHIKYTIPLLFGVLLVYVIVAIFIFKKGILLNLVYPPLTLVIVSLTSISTLALTEKQHKKHILTVFGKYVSKDIVDHLLKSEKAIELGGEEKQITAMFADIRGFTAMSEKMTPHQVIEVLNHYFGDMTDLVFKHDGTLDKFIGDCLFAIWGSPLEDKDHALKAVKCCLDIQKKLQEKHTKDIPPINLGIGMCSGPAVVGNMGSPQRQEFTAIGDTVNTASRLAGQASGGQIIISESTYRLVKEKVKVKKLPAVKVKGKEKPLQIYQALKLI